MSKKCGSCAFFEKLYVTEEGTMPGVCMWLMRQQNTPFWVKPGLAEHQPFVVYALDADCDAHQTRPVLNGVSS